MENGPRPQAYTGLIELGRVSAKGTDEQLEIFYTGLYHNMIHPSIHVDVNGQYRGLSYRSFRGQGLQGGDIMVRDVSDFTGDLAHGNEP